jgi:hypothetical protein
MNNPTKVGAILGAVVAALVAIPVLYPMIFFMAADNQTFRGLLGAIFQCILYGALFAFGGAFCGSLIGWIVSVLTRGTRTPISDPADEGAPVNSTKCGLCGNVFPSHYYLQDAGPSGRICIECAKGTDA